MIWLVKEDKIIERDLPFNDEVKDMAITKGYKVFDDNFDALMAISEYKQKNGICSVDDILEQFGVSSVPVLVNQENECFENTVKSNDLIKEEQLNQTDKSNHGGKRVGAGRKPGTSVKHNQETKDKIAQALQGNKNAMKQENKDENR